MNAPLEFAKIVDGRKNQKIQFWMHELGHSEDGIPSLATIKRIIKRNGMVVQEETIEPFDV